nr:MAG TPA: hypothetical protein [Caudoviricetes sp.]
MINQKNGYLEKPPGYKYFNLKKMTAASWHSQRP